MVRDNRVKDCNWVIPASAATTSTTYSDHAPNGKIWELDYKFNRAGSITLFISGTSETIFSTKDVSGTSVQVVRPAVVQKYPDNTFVIGSITQSFVVNAPIGLTVTGLASGANPLYVNVRYI
jgi:hypothetical protein